MDANEAGSVPSNVGTQLPQNAEASSRRVVGLFKLIFAHKAISIITVVLLIIIGVAIFAGQKLYQANKAASPVASRFDDQKIPLGSAVAPGALQLNTSQALSINGQLRANNTLVLSPSTQPTRGTAGQLYYDSTASRILYHNGQSFIAVADTALTDQLQVQLQSTASQAEVASLADQLQALQGQLGQIQVPAEVRRRWATDRVMIEDDGTGLRIEPLPRQRRDRDQRRAAELLQMGRLRVDEQLVDPWNLQVIDQTEIDPHPHAGQHGDRPGRRPVRRHRRPEMAMIGKAGQARIDPIEA